MKQARYSLWPEDPAVSRRRTQAKSIVVAFVAGIGVAALSPFAVSYFGAQVEPAQVVPATQQAAQPRLPTPAIAAQFETLQRAQYAPVERTAVPAREYASDAMRRDQNVVAPQRTAGIDIPLPIPRPPDIAEVSKAITAFAEPSDKAAVPNEPNTQPKPIGDPGLKTPSDPVAKIRQADASAGVVKQPRKSAAHSASSKRDVTIYHLPDGRQLRVFGRLSDDDDGDF